MFYKENKLAVNSREKKYRTHHKPCHSLAVSEEHVDNM